MAGAVLAGGQSRRFGKNKALEDFHGERLVDRVVDAVNRICEPVFLIANELEPYLSVSAHLVQDVLPRQGPLGGIYTALLFSPTEWVFVKGTDMPFFVPEVVEAMLDLRHQADAVVPLNEKKYEPLFGLYHVRCLSFVQEALARSRRQIISFYPRIRLRVLEEDIWRAHDPDALNFQNINTIYDYRQLSEQL